MPYQTLEYGFIRINNRRAVGLRPAGHQQLSAVIAPALIGNVLANLQTAGWRLSSDNTFTGNETGDYDLKIERVVEIDDDETRDDPHSKFRTVKAREPLDNVQLDMERKGWELIRITRPITGDQFDLLFSGPKHLP
jgi:hypothetical protein